MSFDGVAWLIGGGAEHSPEIGRLLAYAATRDASGVILPGDMKVQALAVPGVSVRIAPGGCAMLNKNPGARAEAYLGRAPSETVVGISAGGASGRNDVLIARVEDPQYAGWAAPANLQTGPYFKPHVLQGISGGDIATIKATKSLDVLGLTYPAAGLATIEVPASTATITGAMITDIRQLAAPRTKTELFMDTPTPDVTLTTNTGTQYPSFQVALLVPKWATEMQVITHISMIGQENGAVTGYMAAVLNRGGGVLERRSSNITYDFTGSAGVGERRSLLVAGTFDVTALAGQVYTLRTEAIRNAGAGYLVTRTGTQMIYDVRFTEKVA